MTLPHSVRLVEVGPRDGLQNEPEVITPAERAELVRRLAGTGLRTHRAPPRTARSVPAAAGDQGPWNHLGTGLR